MDTQDPLLAALIGKLPTAGTSWPAEKRAAWLELMWKAFAVVYEGDDVTELPAFLSVPMPEPRPPLRVVPPVAREDDDVEHDDGQPWAEEAVAGLPAGIRPRTVHGSSAGSVSGGFSKP